MKAMGMLLLTATIGGGTWAAACSSGPSVGSLEQPLCNCDVEDPPCCCTSPILIDVAGDGLRLTSWADGVEFAPRPGFHPSARAWTEPNSDDAWLALDRDGDGVINDGSEMFGNSTPQPQPAVGTRRNGFLALAQYDDDRNGVIDEHDAIFSELRLWQDIDHDGVSQPWEVHALPELGVAGISLAYTEAREADRHGNSFRYKAAVYGTPGSPVGMTAWDVWLVGVRPEPVANFREADTGNPKELKRCYRAAEGDYYTWRKYCKTVPMSIRPSCYELGNQSEQKRKGWCDEHWGSIITCTG
jgi:hypothetical protein